MSGDDGKEVTPVPIPNTEVKLFSADGSWGLPPARVGRRFANQRLDDIGSFFDEKIERIRLKKRHGAAPCLF